jgi:uncharacterized protein YycO
MLLQPGDHILYRPSSFFGWLIAVKTWTLISHIEVFIGNNQTVASRPGKGVAIFEYDETHAARILRPKTPLNLESGMQWFSTVAGQKYDYWGLLVFVLARRKGAADKQFCSELVDRFDNAAGFWPFAPEYAPDRLAPAQFLQSAEFTEVWSDGKFAARHLTY